MSLSSHESGGTLGPGALSSPPAGSAAASWSICRFGPEKAVGSGWRQVVFRRDGATRRAPVRQSVCRGVVGSSSIGALGKQFLGVGGAWCVTY